MIAVIVDVLHGSLRPHVARPTAARSEGTAFCVRRAQVLWHGRVAVVEELEARVVVMTLPLVRLAIEIREAMFCREPRAWWDGTSVVAI